MCIVWESRRAIVTPVDFQEVNVFVVVVDSAEESCRCATGMFRANVLSFFHCKVQFGHRLIEQYVSATFEIDIFNLLGIETCHRLKVVFLGETLLIVHVGVKCPRVFFRVVFPH